MSMAEKQIKEQVPMNHPKLLQALTTFTRMIGLSAAFEPNPELEKKIKKMNIYFNEGDACYTNFHAIFLGMEFPYFKGDNIDEVYNRNRIISGHEMAHIRFTSKSDWDKFVYTAQREYGILANLAKDVLNILEDPRIERLMGLTNEFLQKGFYYLRYEMVRDIPKNINEEINSMPMLEASAKLQFIRNALLYMASTRVIPKIEDDEIMDILKKCYPYTMYARQGSHTKHAVKATKKILEILKDLMDDYKQETNEKIEALFKNKDVGTNSPSDGKDGFQQTSSQSEAFPLPKELEEMIKEKIKQAKKELGDEDGEGNGEGEGEEGQGGKKGKEKGENQEKGKGEKSDSDDDRDGSLGESDDINTEDRDFVDDITGNMDVDEELEQGMKNESKKLEQEMKRPITNEILHELLHSQKKSNEQKVKEQKEIENIKDLNPEMDTDLHNGIKAIFKEREKMFKFSKLEYDNLKRDLEPIIIKTAHEIEQLAQLTIERALRRRKRGRLDKKRLIDLAAFNDPKVFIKKKIEEEMLKMDVMLLIDVSGSNAAQMLNNKNDTYTTRYIMNQIVAILVHEILKRVKFKHSVWTFYEGSRDTHLSPAIDRSNCFEKDAGHFLKEVGAWGCNRDGFAIRYAGEYLNKFSEDKKRLLIVLSDGQPSGSGYGGRKAMQDVKAAVTQVEKNGSKTVGIFTGHKEENKFFENMYENHIFVNNESIFELPKLLKDLLIKEFEDYLQQYS